jgi:hypothetical protein
LVHWNSIKFYTVTFFKSEKSPTRNEWMETTTLGVSASAEKIPQLRLPRNFYLCFISEE